MMTRILIEGLAGADGVVVLAAIVAGAVALVLGCAVAASATPGRPPRRVLVEAFKTLAYAAREIG